jgi:hypothetical protein
MTPSTLLVARTPWFVVVSAIVAVSCGSPSTIHKQASIHATGDDPNARVYATYKEISDQAKDTLARGDKVNPNWTVGCVTDSVTQIKKCHMATFGVGLGEDGEPWRSLPPEVYNGSPNYLFEVYFAGRPGDMSGPFVKFGIHDFPGRYPTVRIDGNAPLNVNDDGGVSVLSPDRLLVDQIVKGKVARARYHQWPYGAKEMYVDLTGSDEAWQILRGQVR